MQPDDQDQEQQQAGGTMSSIGHGIMNQMRGRYRGGQGMSMRGDGSNVPGNQPGGENGSYGSYGQAPNAEPPSTPPAGTPSFGGQMRNQMMNRFQHSPGGQIIQAGINRYRGPQGGQQPNPMGSGVDPSLTQGGPEQPDTAQQAMMGQPQMAGNSITGISSAGDGQQNAAMAAQQASGISGKGFGMSPNGGDQQNAAMVANNPNMQQSPQSPTPNAGSASSPPQHGTMTPFGMMGGTPKMAEGGIVHKPTIAMLGEKGPEAVVPLTGNHPRLTPGMFSKQRYRRPTGPSSINAPMGPMEHMSMMK